MDFQPSWWPIRSISHQYRKTIPRGVFCNRCKVMSTPCEKALKPAKSPPRRATSVSPEVARSEEHTSELQSRGHLVCRLLLEKKNRKIKHIECEESCRTE